MTPEEKARLRVNLTDEQAVAATLFGEAASEPIAGIVGVACVIRNRALANPTKWWGIGYRAVCLKPAQFSCWWEDNANTTRVYALAEQLVVAGPLGERTALTEIRWVAAGVIGEQLRDITQNADHYLTTDLFRSPRCPSWAKGKMPVATIGAHSFFRLEI